MQKLAQTTSELAVGPDEFVPDTFVCREFGVTAMTLWRWGHDAILKFPPAIKIRRRNFRSRRALEQFKASLIRKSASEESRPKRMLMRG
jgi:hypothetical protein